MSSDPAILNHDSPESARPLNGMTRDGHAIYQCARCLRFKTSAEFGANQFGKKDGLCTSCMDRVGVSNQKQRYIKDRSHLTVTSKVCNKCGLEKPTDSFWLDGKEEDGLKRTCAACTLMHKSPSQQKKPVEYESFLPASAIQPALDQAIEERDALAGEIERLQALVTELQRASQNQTPRTDLLALNAIETEIRWLREQLEAKAPDDAVVPRYVRKGIQQACLLVGPVAYAVFKWADRQVLNVEDRPESRKARR